MIYYFKLRYTMFNRRMSDFGIHPILGYIGILTAYILLSNLIFYKTVYAAPIYTFLSLFFIVELSESKRNELLKICFSHLNYLKVRWLENVIVLMPPLIYLGYKNAWIFVLILFLVGSILALFNFRKKLHFTMSTPFYKYPYEYLIGFRKYILLLGFAYFLLVMGAVVGNFNLGLFSLLIVFVTSLFFYSNPDNQYYTWIHALESKAFLLHKIKIASLYLLLLSSPVLLVLGIVFPSDILIVLISILVAMLYLLTYILAKYAAFPDAINLPQIILYTITLMFPPFLIFIIPFFYKKSIEKLNFTLS